MSVVRLNQKRMAPPQAAYKRAKRVYAITFDLDGKIAEAMCGASWRGTCYAKIRYYVADAPRRLPNATACGGIGGVYDANASRMESVHSDGNRRRPSERRGPLALVVDSVKNCLYVITSNPHIGIGRRERMRNMNATALSHVEGRPMYTPQHIANYFLDRAAAEGRPITPIKLIKLVYIAYGWVLALVGRRLFDEPIQAWKHGPVIPSLYHEFKHFGSSPIDGRASLVDYYDMEQSEPRIDNDRDTLDILDKVWAAYHRFTGWALREKTHAVGTPWEQTYIAGQNAVIEDELIAPHYRARIGEILDAAGA